jgi:phosphatidate cytidylyltransferase
MIGIREITAAYGKGGIELPDYVLMIAATVLLVATWNGNTQGLAVSTGLTIPILMFTLLLISQKDFIKRSATGHTAAAQGRARACAVRNHPSFS